MLVFQCRVLRVSLGSCTHFYPVRECKDQITAKKREVSNAGHTRLFCDIHFGNVDPHVVPPVRKVIPHRLELLACRAPGGKAGERFMSKWNHTTFINILTI